MGNHIKVNNYKLRVDLLDMAFLGRLVTANDALQAAMSTADTDFPGDDPQMQYKRMDANVNAVCTFFDAVFGVGTAELIFKRSNDAGVYQKALQDFTRGIEKVDKAVCRKFRFR